MRQISFSWQVLRLSRPRKSTAHLRFKQHVAIDRSSGVQQASYSTRPAGLMQSSTGPGIKTCLFY